MNKSLFSSDRPDWCTPQSLVDLLWEFGPVHLDPCSNGNSTINALIEWTKADDGLKPTWGCDGLVYVNPPYGREIRPWVEKCSAEAKAGAEIIGLFPSRTDSKWFQNNVLTCDLLLLWRGRLRFQGAPSSAPFPSVLAYWGRQPQRFQQVFGQHGVIVRPCRGEG